MSSDLSLKPFWSFPTFFKFPPLLDEDEDWLNLPSSPSGLSISEDNKYVYVEAAIPGVNPADVDITFHKGVLWIKAKGKQEEKDSKKKYYRLAQSDFQYRVAVPGEIDDKIEPEASSKNGVITIKFTKLEVTQPKKITLK